MASPLLSHDGMGQPEPLASVLPVLSCLRSSMYGFYDRVNNLRFNNSQYMYMYVYIYIYIERERDITYVYIYIYIYRERERYDVSAAWSAFYLKHVMVMCVLSENVEM